MSASRGWWARTATFVLASILIAVTGFSAWSGVEGVAARNRALVQMLLYVGEAPRQTRLWPSLANLDLSRLTAASQTKLAELACTLRIHSEYHEQRYDFWGAELAWALHRDSVAVATLSRMASVFQPAALELGAIYLQEGDPDGAGRIWAQTSRPTQTTFVAPLLLQEGDIAYKTKRPVDAVSFFTAAVWIADGELKTWKGLADSRLQLGQRNGAAEAYRRALEITSDPAMVLSELLRETIQLGRTGKTAESFKAARLLETLAPAWEYTWNSQGLVLLEAGNLKEAEDSFSRALEINPDSIAGNAGMGSLLLARGSQNAEAEEHFERAVQADAVAPSLIDTGPWLLQAIVAAYARAGDLATAQRWSDAAVAQYSEAAVSHYMSGIVRLQLRDSAGSVAALEKAVNLDRQNLTYRRALAATYRHAGLVAAAAEQETAIKQLEQGVRAP